MIIGLKIFWKIEDLLTEKGFTKQARKLEKIEDKYYKYMWHIYDYLRIEKG